MMDKTLDLHLAQMNRQLLGLLHGILSDVDSSKVVPPYDRWLTTSYEFLAESKQAIEPNLPLAQRWLNWEHSSQDWLSSSDLRAQVLLVQACLQHLTAVLTGRMAAHEVLFPDGSMERVEGIHRGNTVADFFNGLLCEQVIIYLRARTQLDPYARLRILEVGGGVGATTQRLLEKCQPFAANIQEYCFTDVSEVFLRQAQERFSAQHPYFLTRLFNIDEAGPEQGFLADHFDIVIAANVLHVAVDIRQSLRHLKVLMHRNGFLFINELSQRSLFTHLTFGLLEAWWSATDTGLRIAGSPVVSYENWEKVLQTEGFPKVKFPALAQNEQGQQIIVAQSDGVIRQAQRQQTHSVLPALPALESSPNIPPNRNKSPASLRAQCVSLVTAVLASTLKLSPSKINPAKKLESYGLDSILAIQLTKSMRVHFEGIRTTLFFEADTVNALTDYLLATQETVLHKLFDAEATEATEFIVRHAATEATDAPSKRSQAPLVSAVESQQDIAIVGLAGKFPGASDVAQFWDNLLNGRDAISGVPAGRWGTVAQNASLPLEPPFLGGFIKDVECFDPLFFDISPREAEFMSPEERLFLETVWVLLESTGYTRDWIATHHAKRVGVYVGAMYQHYREEPSTLLNKALVSIASYSAIANRVSHFFDFQGPSIAVDTMCSASTVAIHMACESLKKGECSLAIAGGVNLSLHPSKFIGLRAAKLTGTHEQSRSFSQGDGYLPAEAVGAVLLKSLPDALRDGDHILAVIKASATNHDGYTPGISVPNLKAQTSLIEENFKRSGIAPRSIGYVEAAANGSALGDPIEVSAQTRAFRTFTDDTRFCVLGSVKSNIGHPEAASGIAQLTKVVLQLHHRQFVPTIRAWPLNQDLELDNTPFFLLEKPMVWEPIKDSLGQPLARRASVSSFGGGGSNAHLILEEHVECDEQVNLATALPQPIVAKGAHAILLSARTTSALREMVIRLRDYLSEAVTVPLWKVALTLQCGRQAMEIRLGFVVHTIADLQLGLSEYLTGELGVITRITGRVETEFLAQARTVDASTPEGENATALLQRWIRGEAIAWHLLYKESGPYLSAIVQLPTYPFERIRCWLPTSQAPLPHGQASLQTTSSVHSFVLSTDTPFLKDHEGVIPAMLHLDLAQQAAGIRIARFRNVVWLRPSSVTTSELNLRVHLRQDHGVTFFESFDETGQMLCRGEMLAHPIGDSQQPAPLNLEALRTRALTSVSRAQCDRILLQSNGPTLLTIERLQYSDSIALASLVTSSAPRADRESPSEYALAFDVVGLLNGAILSSVIWEQLQNPAGDLPVPFALESLDLFSVTPPAQAYVQVTLAMDSAERGPRKSELILTDARGQIFAHFKGFTALPALAAIPAAPVQIPQSIPEGISGLVAEELSGMLCTIQKIRREQVDPLASWSRFGMASLGFAEFALQINQHFRLSLMPTVFFEHTTLSALAHFLTPLIYGSAAARAQAKMAEAEASMTVSAAMDSAAAVPDKPMMKIAIVGISARLPGSNTLDEYWEHLQAGADLVSEVPVDRWDWRAYWGDPMREPGKTRAKWGGFIEGIDHFDPRFFGLSPRDAEGMDPQSRLVLESAWSAVEDAGYAAHDFAAKNIGVFVGVSTADYKDLCAQAEPGLAAQVKPFLIANRVSYHMDLRGPSEVIDTACSSSMVALHRGVQALREGTCEAALVGGVNVIASPEISLSLSRSGVLSEDGRCMAFDSRANGMVRGEGVGMVLLKSLDQAIAQGDHIYGVILASVVNQDGRSSSASAPNPVAQANLIYEAMHQAEIDPRSITYIEAHGTGTELGDPIEIRGLQSAFEKRFAQLGLAMPTQPYCGVGSVKTNIGHLEAAAGIASLIKVLLMFRHGRLPANIHLRSPNPYLELQGSPFYLVGEGSEWPPARESSNPFGVRRAGLSSFGIGGTNAHVIVEEYREHASRNRKEACPQTFGLIPLSARDEPALRRVVGNLQRYLSRHPELSLADLSYTLQCGREHLGARVGVVVTTTEELMSVLSNLEQSHVSLTGLFESHQAVQESAILQSWVNGDTVAWESFYEGCQPFRVSLPTYPFARESYWVQKLTSPAPEVLQSKIEDPYGTERILCQPVWHAVTAVESVVLPVYSDRLTLLCGEPFNTLCLTDQHVGELVCLSSSAQSSGQFFEQIACAAFEHVRALLEHRPKGRALIQLVIARHGANALLAGLAGMLKTAALENSRVSGQLIEVDASVTEPELFDYLNQSAAYPDVAHVRYVSGRREVFGWKEIVSGLPASVLPWREGGVYLVSGGAGGLGLIFAKEIAQAQPKSTLILIGRSRLNQDTQKHLCDLRSQGCQIEYQQCDVAKQKEVEQLILDISERFGAIHGVLHCAGINRGRYILKKSPAEFAAVLAPKVLGAQHLDWATRLFKLDLFVVFASGAGAVGYAGQSDYACANGFLDCFATYREQQVKAGLRSGRTLAIDWPLWKDGGMRVDQTSEDALRESTGMSAMTTPNGIGAFYEALSTDFPQVAVVAGDPQRIRLALLAPQLQGKISSQQSVISQSKTDVVASKTLLRATLEQLKTVLADQLKVAASELESEVALEHYGIDSVMIIELNARLEFIFGPIPKTLLFEVQTLGQLAQYFLENYASECNVWTGLEQQPVRAASRSSQVRPAVTSIPVTSDSAVSSSVGSFSADDPIAIIGMAGRFPQAANLEQFWENLKAGRDSITELPQERWPLEGFFEEDPELAVRQGKSYTKWGGFIEGATDFDPLFFNISPREALMMDPQERVFLQTAWAAVEDAGYTRESLRRVVGSRVGVFAGITKTGFDLYGPDLWRKGEHNYPHTSFGSVANRVSYMLDLSGPSMPIDTLCSSSLTALHEGCRHILSGECEMALVGGVNIYLHPSSFTSLCAYGFLAHDHRCKSFGEGGKGFVPGEGVGVVVLKRLSQALRDRDQVHALILGTSVNHDGKTNGYTVPNPLAQTKLIRQALNSAGVDARAVSYVEAHGTGTELGDPIEISGLTQAYRQDTSDTAYAAIGSVKSNIGHLEAAAGMAGLFKIILQMRHGQLAPSLHAETLNPHIDFDATPFVVQRQFSPWQRPVLATASGSQEMKRIAGISSFGAGGSNAHAVLEEYVSSPQPVTVATGHVAIVLSARDEPALVRSVRQLLAVALEGKVALQDLAYTLQVGREPLAVRLALLTDSMPDLARILQLVLAHVASGAVLIDSAVSAGVWCSRVKGEKVSLAHKLGEDEAATVIQSWLSSARLEKLLEQWVVGLSFDWETLYHSAAPKRISLPTYPFARERYWLNVAPSQPSGIAGSHLPVEPQALIASEVMTAHPLSCFREVWEPVESTNVQSVTHKIICCVADSKELSTVEKNLATRGCKSVFCFSGDPEQNESLLKTYLAQHADLDRVLFLGTGRECETAWIASLLRLLGQAGISPTKIVLAGTFSDALARCHIDSWIGFERSLRLTLPKTQVVTLLLASVLNETPTLDLVWNELCLNHSGAVLLQDGVRLEPTLLPWTPGNQAISFTGTVLITGGVGGLGLLCAEYLAKRSGVKLILTGRSALDAPKRERIQTLQASGSEVFYLQADVCDEAAMRAGLALAKARFGPIQGVIHAAGITASGTLFGNDRQTFTEVLAPKIQGTQILDRVLAGEALRFVCYFSSSSAILGDFGSCNYSIGNRFLMAYGAARQAILSLHDQQSPCVVINWPLWRQGTMGQGSASATALYLQSSGQRLLESSEAFALFERLIGQVNGHCLVLAAKPEALKRLQKPPTAKQKVVIDQPDTMHWRIEDSLQAIAGKLLGIAPQRIEVEANLSDFGFDSITLAEYADEISATFGITVAPALFFGHPTIAELAHYFAADQTVIANFDGAVVLANQAADAVGKTIAEPAEHETSDVASADSQTPALALQDPHGEPIAIIGMSGHFPNANSVHAFWSALCEGKSAISAIPVERLDAAVDASERGAFLDDIHAFDPLFFEIPPSEAEAMDPRQRVFLEVAWEALEDACAMGSRIRGTRCGVYVGVEEGLTDTLAGQGAINRGQNATLAARIAYLLDLEGPNFALTSACSSALVALHQACLALRQGDCDTALVGGVNLILTTGGFASLRQAEMLSQDGECRVFDQGATGMVPGEAVVAVVLKPLSAALRDGDPIHACIKGSAVNYDGKTNGITAPNPVRQAILVERLYRQMQFNPADLQFVMAHSVASQMGDPIEIEALSQAFSQFTAQRGFCAIGSVKPLVGHTFAASGLVSLIATVMAMKHGVILGLRHLETLNNDIQPAKTPFVFARDNQVWMRPQQSLRRAALGATGISGTNVHIVLEEFPVRSADSSLPKDIDLLIPLSAKTPDRLQALVQRLSHWLQNEPDVSLADVGWTLALGRESMKYRLALVASSLSELLNGLNTFLEQDRVSTSQHVSPSLIVGRAERVRRDPIQAAAEIAQAAEANDLPRLGLLWTQGYELDWSKLYANTVHYFQHLPTYPFAQRRSDVSQDENVYSNTDTPTIRPTEQAPVVKNQNVKTAMTNLLNIPVATDTSTVAALYQTIAELERPEFKEGFLTFFPLPEKIPGFSITRVGLYPQEHPKEVALIHAQQRESRRVLLARANLENIETLLDFGCGYGTDMIELATRYPNLTAHGYTLSPAQANIAQQHIARVQLESRVKVFQRDSTTESFPDHYDLVLGIEVCCHIENKEALFRNIVRSLNAGGRVLLMDFVVNLRGAILDRNVSVHIPNASQWVELISAHGFEIEESVDLSAQIAHSIDDPECEDNTKDLPAVLRDSWRNWTNNAVAIHQGWVGYRQFRLRLNPLLSAEALRALNQQRFATPTLYPEALSAMLAAESAASLKIVTHALAGSAVDSQTAIKLNPDGDLQIDIAAVRNKLEHIFCKTLRLTRSELAESESIQELGLDSLNAVALLEAINIEFELTLPTSVVFEFGTIEALADYIGPRVLALKAPVVDARPSPVPSLPRSQSVAQAAPVVPIRQADSEKDAIAIVGFACRSAGADNAEELWRLVSEGRDAISEITDPAWLAYFQQHAAQPQTLRYGAMKGIDCFDPLFFRISPKEADAMGVSQRILLQECYRALESAGYAPGTLRGQAVGTYIGLASGVDPEETDLSHFAMLGVDTSIAAARIAFLLDLKGPALAINTACSSSLVAIDLAAKALLNGDINMALAGGITIWDHPAPFISMNHAGMLSPNGQCRPFDSGANGIVVGDGVGVVVLKRLEDAERDGDTIHAVIRGSGTNQDGQTSGITVPSFLSQSHLQASVYRRAGINPQDIQYLEAHGTATKLGDPVEIHALTDSFAKFTNSKSFCAIASLKANIGHTATAAGVLSLIKVMCAMQHRQIPPSIHFERENEHIDFVNSPVYVNTALVEWPLNAKGKRLAAVSSFGYSGTNAHLVLESYDSASIAISEQDTTDENRVAKLFVLSAREPAQLKQLAANLKQFIQTQKTTPSLSDLAYTLQIGRDALQHRLAFIADNVTAVQVLLADISQGRTPVEGFWQGQSEVKDSRLGLLLNDEDATELIGRWLARGKISKLAELWVAGYALDWKALYRETLPRRLRLPGYSFELRVCHMPPVGMQRAKQINLHPLLHQNISGLNGVSFQSDFTGREHFLADHRVKGVAVLPGVAYLEMAYAAAQLAGATGGIVLRQVGWVRPLTVTSDGGRVVTTISRDDFGCLHFEVTSGVSEHASVMHCRGAILTDQILGESRLNLHDLQKQTSTQSFSAEHCYQTFAQAGVDYGPTHRVLDSVSVGASQALAHLSLSDAVLSGTKGFALHPSLLDGALQATVALLLAESEFSLSEGRPMLPFVVDEVQIYRPCPASVWVWLRPSAPRDQAQTRETSIDRDHAQASDASAAQSMIDIDLCDEQGFVCVALRGLVSRTLPSKQTTTPTTTTEALIVCHPVWEPAPMVAASLREVSRRLVFTLGLERSQYEALRDLRPGWEWLMLPLTQQDIGARTQALALTLFERMKDLLSQRDQSDALVQVVIPDRGDLRVSAALAALLKTFQHERKSLRGQLIEVDPSAYDSDQLVQVLEHSAGIADGGPIHTIQGVQHAIHWRALTSECKPVIPWKDGGVYLITGGAGSLGLLFAKDIVANARRCSLVLLGRSMLSAATEQQLNVLRNAGAASVQYHQVDVTDASALEEVVRQTLQSRSQLNGVLHAAGVIHDGVIQNKSAEVFESVLRPKVAGAVNLDIATATLKLDLFVLFSSGAGAWGNAGQVDYATANSFMDHFSEWRSEQVSAGLRSGLTLSVNWPLWKEGGMQVDRRTQERMKQSIGAVPLESQAGLSAFYLGIGSGFSRIAVMQGDPVRLRAAGFGAAVQETVIDPSVEHLPSGVKDFSVDNFQSTSQRADLRRQWIRQHLAQLLCQALGVKPSELEDKRDLSSYGLDSILVLDINNRLNKTFTDVPQTLFFEYNRLSDLVDYFLDAYGKEIDKLMAPESSKGVARSPQIAASSTPVLAQPLPAVVKHDAQPEVSRVKVLSLDERIKKMDAELDIGGNRQTQSDDQALHARRHHSPFHSVAAFPKPLPGFSLSRSLVTPESCGVELVDMVQRQADIRRVLFAKETVGTFGRVLDLGCGIGTDLIELASSHPGLIGHGLTLSEEDARVAELLIRSRGLQERIKIICSDNSLHRYQATYDLVFSIQTMHFLTKYADKQALFGKLSRALGAEGRLLMAEYVCTLEEPMRDPVLKVSVHTAQQWARLLGENGLVLTEVIDLSAEVIHFLYDPDLEHTLATLESARADEVRKLSQQIVALQNGWVRFCLLKVNKAPELDSEVLTERNSLLMDRAQSYVAAFGEMQKQTQSSAYTAVLQRFPEFLQTARGVS